jgi:putative PIN family toxin of toxin-antitoxin system
MGPESERVRAVFYCMVFLQGAARRESPSGICLLLAERGIVELCISAEILSEVVNVLNRSRVRSKFPALSDDVVEEFVRVLRRISTFFTDVPRQFVLTRDPKDEPYLNLAYHAQARYLVTPICLICLPARGSQAQYVIDIPLCRSLIRVHF